jgi:shikimate kinase
MNSRASVRECAPKTHALFLVGFMGAGKSSVGELLGQRLGWLFEDLDVRIQQRDGRSIEQIFAESGELYFRRVEHAALREVVDELGTTPRVIALGGGAFAQPENIELLKSAGVATVFLDGAVDELFRKLYADRRGHYMTASLRVDTSGKDVVAVAAEVVEALGL